MSLDKTTLPKHTVLVVDDEPAILSALRRVLRLPGVDVECFDSPQDALSYLQEHTVQVVLSDFRMPKMNGAEFLSRAKSIQPGIIAIVLSGYTDSDMLIAMINNHTADKFICKPWENQALITEVTAALDASNANYFNNLVKTKLQSNSAPRILIDDEGNILKHNLPNTITTALISNFAACFAGNGSYTSPIGELQCEILHNSSDETYLIEINKQHSAENELNILQLFSQLLISFTINSEPYFYTLDKTSLDNKAAIEQANLATFRHITLLECISSYYVLVLDPISVEQLPRKAIELEIQIEKQCATALSDSLHFQPFKLNQFIKRSALF